MPKKTFSDNLNMSSFLLDLKQKEDSGALTEAIINIKYWATSHELNDDMIHLLGRLYHRLGLANHAIRAYSIALKIKPNLPKWESFDNVSNYSNCYC